MIFDIITLFPEMFSGPLSESIIKRAQDKKLIEIKYHNLRDYAEDKHKTVDDTPYGGGKGMVLKVDVVDRALRSVISTHPEPAGGLRVPPLPEGRLGGVGDEEGKKSHHIILLTPQGKRFTQDKAIELAQKYDRIILICGHYEGFDERIRDLVDEEISIGDFVLTGGEIPAMAIVDAVSRMVPGVLAEGSSNEETFMQKNEKSEYLKEYPQYTRPEEYKEAKVPEILLSGDHGEIKKWRENHR